MVDHIEAKPGPTAPFHTFVELMDDTRVGLFILDRDFNLVWINHAIERYFGLERAAVLGQDKRHLIQRQLKQIFAEPDAFARRVLATYDDNSYVEQFECHVLPGGGLAERWLEHWSQPITAGPYAGGRLEQYTDITRRKQAEHTLAVRTRQQAAVARLGQQALAGGDLQPLMEGAVTTIADILQVEYTKVLQLLPDREALLLLAGVGWQPAYPVGEATVGAGLDSQAGYTLLSAEPVIVDDLRSDSRFSGPPLLHEHHVVSGISVIIGPVDDPFGVLGVHTTRRRAFGKHEVDFVQAVANILATAIERTEAETALRASEVALRELNRTLEQRVEERTQALQRTSEALLEARDRFFTLFHASPVATILTEPEGGTVLDINTACLRYLGPERAEIVGRPTAELDIYAVPSDRARIRELIAQTGQVRAVEMRLRDRDGRERVALVSVEMVALAGKPVALATLVDISERVEAEQQIRRLASELSLAEERERKRIAQILHDDLQQMLVALQIMVQQKAEAAGAQDSFAEVGELLDEIFEANRNLSVDLSSPAFGTEKLTESFSWLAAYMSERYALAVDVQVGEGCAIPDQELRALVVRLVRELLFNVVKHAGVERARVHAYSEEGVLAIRVEDEGQGFAPASLKRRAGGTGFGLMSMGERLHLFGGRLEIAAAPGKGTCVTLFIPQQAPNP